jgi:hypothetical protein
LLVNQGGVSRKKQTVRRRPRVAKAESLEVDAFQ